MKTLDDIGGYEYDWLGCDRLGQIALLSTAGIGIAPDVFLLDTDKYDQAIENIFKLPVSTSVVRFPEIGDELVNTWLLAAERGIYGYDASAPDGIYSQVSIPEVAILVNQLPSEIATVVRLFQFNAITFNSAENLQKTDIIGL